MTRNLFLPATIVALLAGTPARAQSVDAIFRSANDAYFAGDAAAACTRYQALIDAGIDDADVYYDLGVAEASRSRLGRALHAFESSLRIRPGDEGTLQARDAIIGRIGRARADREGEATLHTDSNVLRALAKLFTARSVAILCLVLAWIVGGCFALRGFVRGETLRLGLAIGAIVGALLLVPSGVALAVHARWLGGGVEAIVLDDHVPLREGPDPRAAHEAEAREGDRGEVGDRLGGFVRLRIAGRGEGWAPAASVGVVGAPAVRAEHPLH